VSDPASTGTGAPATASVGAQVRRADPDDVPAIAAAVGALLRELGSTPPPAPAIEDVARELIADRGVAALLVAEAEGAIVGVLGASLQTAMHVPGRYALIQDLWVHPSWRSRAIGAALIDRLCELAREQRLARIEVGLPRESFAAIRATEAFYLGNGFQPLGERMRRVLG